MSTPHLVYVSFDRFPSPKGAATHIDAFVRALASAFGHVDLVTLAPDPEEAPYDAPGVTHHGLDAQGENMIGRALDFRGRLQHWWGDRRPDVVHVRSIFEGYPLARARPCGALVAEINGLPSIELKYHYSAVADDAELLRKLEYQERVLVEAADVIVTPSSVTAAHVESLGARRVEVIPNGVDTDLFDYASPRLEELSSGRPLRLLQSGTMTAWQGVLLAVEALALYRRDYPATLTLVGPARRKQRRAIEDRALDLGVADAVTVMEPVSRATLAALHHEHDVALAPLLPNDRNLVQGCCPLKIVEAMAAGPLVVASDLPVVTELAENDKHALLVRPGSAKAIKDALLRVRADPGLVALSRAARARVEEQFTWARAGGELARVYRTVL